MLKLDTSSWPRPLTGGRYSILRLPVYYPSSATQLQPHERKEYVLSDEEDHRIAHNLVGGLVAALVHPTFTSTEPVFGVLAKVVRADATSVELEGLQMIEVLEIKGERCALAKLLLVDDDHQRL